MKEAVWGQPEKKKKIQMREREDNIVYKIQPRMDH